MVRDSLLADRFERPDWLASNPGGVYILTTHEPAVWASRSFAPREEGRVKKEEFEEKSQLLSDLKAERDSIEQRVIYLTSQIRDLEEELALHLKGKP